MRRLVSELEGAELDYWVARAEGTPVEQIEIRQIQRSEEFHCVRVANAEDWCKGPPITVYDPSTNWAKGGPLIEREHIGIAYYGGDEWTAAYNGPSSPSAENTDYESYWGFQRSVNMVDGPSPLISAMRAFVTSKYGKNVPDEVQS